jgi:thiol-disulfide isomerase/thioredoxin
VRTLKFAALLVVGALALTGCTTDTLAAQYRDGGSKNYIAGDGTITEIALKNRAKPIEFSGTTERGQKVDSSDYAGQVLVVNFWYAGCPPCRAEAAELQSISKQYANKGVSFLGVNIYDSAPTAIGFEKSYGVTYPSVLDRDTGSVLLAFSGSVPPKATPTTIVLDKEGRVSARVLGELASASILDSLIQTALAEKD